MGVVTFAGGKVGMDAPSGLPAGYTRLAYIQSSGTQYIDTGIKPNQDTVAVADVRFSAFPAAHSFVFGVYTSSNAWCVYYRYSDSQYRAVNGSLAEKNISFPDPTMRTTITLKKAAFAVGENEIAMTASTFSVNLNIYLFAQNRNGAVFNPAACNLYASQIYSNGVLVRDFVPCMSDADGIGLYDLVDGKFYGNAGTGVFIGSEVA